MTTRTIRAVVFDCFGVLTNSPFDSVVAYEEQLGYPRGVLHELLFGDYGDHTSDHPWHKMERGEIPAHEFWAGFVNEAAEAGYPIDLLEFMRHFSAAVDVRDDVLELARALRPAYRTAVVTNNVREYSDMWRGMVSAEESFDAILDSSALGVRKPQPEIFVHACAQLDVEPGEAVFLDDSPPNVAGAEAVGMAGILVGSPYEPAFDELRALLAAKGVAGWPTTSS